MPSVSIDGVTVDPLKQLHDLDRAEFEDSLYLFHRTAWGKIDGSPWRDSWAIEAIAEHLQAVADGEIKRLIINVPPRTGKSTLCNVSFPAWVWAQRFKSYTSGPQVQFLHASYSDRLSLRDSRKCRALIRSSWYQGYWSDRFRILADQDAKHRFGNDTGGERLITSIGGGVTGEGGNIIIIDDANSANEAFSDAKIQEVIDWWDQTMATRLNDMMTGAFINIQQRLSEDDLTGHILSHDEGEWVHLMLPMEYDPDRAFITPIGWKDPRSIPGELLWSERFSEVAVKSLRKQMGFSAEGQLQQLPMPPGGGVIPPDAWLNWQEKNFPLMDFIMASVDTAYTEKEVNDPSAMTVWGVFTMDTVAQANRVMGDDGKVLQIMRQYNEPAPKVMLMDAWAEHLRFDDLVKHIIRTAKLWKIDMLVIENKASGISVSQEIQRLCRSENFTVVLADPKSLDKLARLWSVQHLFNEGMVYAPDREWARKVITEVAKFPKGKHDDLTDTVSQALRRMRDMGLLTRAPEREEEISEMIKYPGAESMPLYPV